MACLCATARAGRLAWELCGAVADVGLIRLPPTAHVVVLEALEARPLDEAAPEEPYRRSFDRPVFAVGLPEGNGHARVAGRRQLLQPSHAQLRLGFLAAAPQPVRHLIEDHLPRRP